MMADDEATHAVPANRAKDAVRSGDRATGGATDKTTGGTTDKATDKATGAKGRRVQVRAERATAWTRAKRAVFLDHLAATCNVQRSAAAAGIATANCYALKRRDAEFAALWDAALEAGYDHIETRLLACAMGRNPTADEIFGGGALSGGALSGGALGGGALSGGAPGGGDADGGDPLATGSGFDPTLALRVLAQRETRRAGRPRGPAGKRAPIEQVRAVLLVKLAALRTRLQRTQQPASPALIAESGGSDPADGGGAPA